ncbi:hypothetical protein [Sutcliffiella deserti]|uniref:hypothetical protein n=1 Tax=Sutcliffiella deserti TaxID=2875501 RepID=UPI001CBA8EE3|nr:hypothetical protein [Sutcliffiella deserti]
MYGDEKVLSNKFIKYTVVFLLIISLGFNYYLYKEKEGYMIQLGVENHLTVARTLNEISDVNTDDWIEILEENKGDVLLERYIGELRRLSREFHGMSGMTPIGMLIDDTIRQYYALEDGMKSGKNIEVYKRAIEENIQFKKTILSQINSEFGEDEKLWYKELSGFQTKTQKEIQEKFIEFQNKQ